MKKVLFYTIPATLLLTLAIGYYAYAWTVDASATAYNTTNYTYTNGTAYASGLNDNLAKVRIKYKDANGQWPEIGKKSGPTQGSAQMYMSRFFAEGTPVKVYADASGVTDGGAEKVDSDTDKANL